MTPKEMEQALIKRLMNPSEDHQAIRRGLIILCRTTDRAIDAMSFAQEFLEHTNDYQERMEIYYFMGQTMEYANDFESAQRFYKLSLELKPLTPFYAYFVRNNLGYSLNQLGRYIEAEPYLREAIPIEPERANAHKNLGLSLEGQGRFMEAAKSFINAVKANASDARSLRHLEEMVERHRVLVVEMPELDKCIRMCREAVSLAGLNRTQNN